MKLIEKGKARKLRRLYMEGLRVELTVCEHSITIETKINEVQVHALLKVSEIVDKFHALNFSDNTD